MPSELEVTAQTDDGLIMGFSHRRWPVFGVQFHPESILTDGGFQILANFMRLAELEPAMPLPRMIDELAAELELRELPSQPVTF